MSERMNPFASSTDPIDHASHRYTRGFRMLTLGWPDGVTFLPVNSCLLSSEKESSRINTDQLGTLRFTKEYLYK